MIDKLVQNKNILITGSSGFLGSKLITQYIKKNKVYGIDINKNNEIKSKNFKFFKIDISNYEEVKNVFKLFKKNNIKIDILINNAANSFFGNFKNRTIEEIDSSMAINLKGSFLMIREYYKHVPTKKLHNLNIVNIASIYGTISPDPMIYPKDIYQNSEIYGATKAGIIQMTKYFAIHLKRKKIRVNCVSPGGIYNNLNPQSNYFINRYSKKNPLERMANVNEIINGIIFLSSDLSSYINGHNLVIDGGMSSW